MERGLTAVPRGKHISRISVDASPFSSFRLHLVCPVFERVPGGHDDPASVKERGGQLFHLRVGADFARIAAGGGSERGEDDGEEESPGAFENGLVASPFPEPRYLPFNFQEGYRGRDFSQRFQPASADWRQHGRP